jgi:hypothetical protein
LNEVISWTDTAGLLEARKPTPDIPEGVQLAPGTRLTLAARAETPDDVAGDLRAEVEASRPRFHVPVTAPTPLEVRYALQRGLIRRGAPRTPVIILGWRIPRTGPRKGCGSPLRVRRAMGARAPDDPSPEPEPPRRRRIPSSLLQLALEADAASNVVYAPSRGRVLGWSLPISDEELRCERLRYVTDAREQRRQHDRARLGLPKDRLCLCGCGERFVPARGNQRYVDETHAARHRQRLSRARRRGGPV